MRFFLFVLELVLSLLVFAFGALWVLSIFPDYPVPEYLRNIIKLIPGEGFEPVIGLISSLISLLTIRYAKARNQPTSPAEVNQKSQLPVEGFQKFVASNYVINNISEYDSRTSIFVGRKDILRSIEDFFCVNTGILFLIGKGGIGKTTTALEFAKIKIKEGKYRNAAYVIDGRNIAIFEEELDNLAVWISHTKYPGNTWTRSNRKDHLNQWLRDNEDWILIIDNVNDLEVISELPKQVSGHIILTTRNPNVDRLSEKPRLLEMTGMNQEDTFLLAKQIDKKIDISDTLGNMDLHELSQGIPLFINLFATHTSNKNSRVINNYNLIASDGKGLAPEEIFSQFIREVIDLIFLKHKKLAGRGIIRKSSIGAVLYILLLSNPKRIPKDIFSTYLKENTFYADPEELNWFWKFLFKLFNNNRYFEKAQIYVNHLIKDLYENSIIELSEDYINIHEIIQSYLLKTWLDISAKNILLRYNLFNFIEFYNTEFKYEKDPIRKRNLLSHLIHIADNLQEMKIESKKVIPVLESISKYFRNENKSQSAEIYSRRLARMSKTKSPSDWKKFRNRHRKDIGHSFSQEALDNYNKGVNQNDIEELFEQQLLKGRSLLFEAKFEDATITFERALGIIDDNSLKIDSNKLKSILFQTALSYASFDIEKGLLYLNRAKKIESSKDEDREIGSTILEASIYEKIAFTKARLDGKSDEALYYYQKSRNSLENVLKSLGEEEYEIKISLEVEICLMNLFFQENFQTERITELVKNEDQILSLFSENPVIKGNFFFIKGLHLKSKDLYNEALKCFYIARDNFESIFGGNKPQIEACNELIKDLES